MEAPATTGAPSAASPSGTPVGVPTSTPATAADLESLLSGDVDSSPPTEGDQDPKEEPDAQKADGEAEPEEKKADEDKPKDKTARRVEKLLKERDGFRKELANVQQAHERETARLNLALKTVMGKLSEREQRLSQYEDLSTADEKLAEHQLRQKVQAEYAKTEKQLAEQAEQQKQQQVQEEARSLVEDSLAEALDAFPHLTDAQLRRKLAEHSEANPDLVVSDASDLFKKLAREIDQEQEALYEQRFLKKHKAKLSAPNPIPSRGTLGVPSGRIPSVEEMAEDHEEFMKTKGRR